MLCHNLLWSLQNRQQCSLTILGPAEDSLSEGRKRKQFVGKLIICPRSLPEAEIPSAGSRSLDTLHYCWALGFSLHLLSPPGQRRPMIGLSAKLKRGLFSLLPLFSTTCDSITVVAFSKGAKAANINFCEIITKGTTMLIAQNVKPKSQFFK